MIQLQVLFLLEGNLECLIDIINMCENHMGSEEIVRFSSVEGSKRHLPPWMAMQQKVGASHVSKSDNVVETNCHTEKDENALKKNALTDHKRETSRRKSNSHAKYEVKRRRNLSKRDGSNDNMTQKEKIRNHSSRDRVRRSFIKKGQNLEDPSHGSCDNDVELTIEDLMAMAEEYVKDYENKEQQEASGREFESKWQFPATSESGTILDSHCENKRSSSSAREALYNSTPTTTTGELIATGTSQTGNPAQDMLDLFLGPLLRSTLEKENKNKSIVEDLVFTYEFTGQNQDEHAREEIVPLMKKRNTLKDKLAMFLD